MGIAGSPGYGAVIYNNLTPNNMMAVATRPDTAPFEIEAGDDFLLTSSAEISGAHFVGLEVPNAAGGQFSIQQIVVEIYRVFPLDSNTVRVPNVPTRANSPSDVALDARDSAGNELAFSSTPLNPTFTSLNSVAPGGIHPSPLQTTGGDLAKTGAEVQIDVTFGTSFSLPEGHYFFVPQVLLTNGAQFYWLSASRPISGSGTTPFAPDLQAWTRDQFLDPDWLRVGTDIVGGGAAAPQFNMAFSLDGIATPEPSAAVLGLTGLALIAAGIRRRTPR